MGYWTNPKKTKTCPRCRGTGQEGSVIKRNCGRCKGKGVIEA